MFIETPYKANDKIWILCDPKFPTIVIETNKGYLLVEPELSGCWDTLLKHLSLVGIKIDDISGCIILHEHYDHVMLLPKLIKEKGRITIYAKIEIIDILKRSKVIEIYQKADVFSSERVYKNYYNVPINKIQLKVKPIEELKELGLEVIDLPGHSPLSTGIIFEKTLLVSDAIGFFGKELGHLPLYFYNYDLYVESIDKISNYLNSIETIIIGHNAVFNDTEIKEAIHTAKIEAKNLKERIINSGIKEDGTKNLFKEIYKGEFLLYPPEIIMECAKYIIRRSWESELKNS